MYKNHLKSVFPSISTIVYLLILPVVITAYTLIVHFTSRLNESQANILSNWYANQSWVQYVSRSTDFIVWGGLAALVLVAIWLVSAIHTTISNHYTEESFVNFNVPRNTWHSQFIVSIAIKLFLLIAALFSFILLVGQSVTLLTNQVTVASNNPTQHSIVLALDAALLMILLQYLILFCFKVERLSRIE